MGPVIGSGRGCQSRFRMFVCKMQGNRRGLVEHQVTVFENRDQSIRIELRIHFALVDKGVAIDEHQPVLDADLVEQDVREQADIAGVGVKLDHGAGSVQASHGARRK